MESKTKGTKKELFYNNIADIWDSKINRKETQKRLNIIFNDLLKNVHIRGKNVIEVGCGLGFFSKIMEKKGARISGIDIGSRLVDITKKKIPKGEFLVGSALKIPFKDNSFDITLCTEVIEHTENPQKAIKELFRITKEGGLIVMTTPNKLFKSIFWLLSFLKIRIYQGNENWLSIREVKKIISLNKGSIIKERYFNFIYPTSFLDKFEDYHLLSKLMINQGYLIKK